VDGRPALGGGAHPWSLIRQACTPRRPIRGASTDKAANRNYHAPSRTLRALVIHGLTPRNAHPYRNILLAAAARLGESGLRSRGSRCAATSSFSPPVSACWFCSLRSRSVSKVAEGTGAEIRAGRLVCVRLGRGRSRRFGDGGRWPGCSIAFRAFGSRFKLAVRRLPPLDTSRAWHHD